MSSEAMTRNDLMSILNKVLPSDHYIEGWEYVGDVYWWQDSWTCPEDGFIEVNVNPSANGWYYRISDSTHPDTGWSHRMGGNYTYSQSQTYFVKKGAVLRNHSMGNVASINVWYYKFVLKNSTAIQSEETTTIGDFTFVKKGTTVDVQGWGSMSVSSAYQSIGTLPEAFRPASTQFIIAVAGNSIGANAVMRILPSGDVSLLATQTLSSQFFAVSGVYML